MSLIAFSGRFYGLSPKRIPLYCVMGKIINNPNNNIPIGTPSQKQIDEYHNDILTNFTQLFQLILIRIPTETEDIFNNE